MDVGQGAVEGVVMNADFWKRRRVFVTGHTGFKGSWLCLWLQSLGADVTGYSLAPPTQPSLFEAADVARGIATIEGDVLDSNKLRQVMSKARPQVVFHLAAQSLVRESYRKPLETFSVNVLGTAHLLEAVRGTPETRAVVVATSDKCYENREWLWGYRECDPMGGHDPYSASKGCAELLTAAYQRSFFESADNRVGVATVRAGNVIGGGDWAADRIVPDAMRAFSHGQTLEVRNPAAVRPWQHVLEPLSGYMLLAESLCDDASHWSGAWNFGPDEACDLSVAEVADEVCRYWPGASWRSSAQSNAPHEAGYLKLDCSKARQVLRWQPRLTFSEAIQMTVAWYRYAAGLESSASNSQGLREFTCRQVDAYVAKQAEASSSSELANQTNLLGERAATLPMDVR